MSNTVKRSKLGLWLWLLAFFVMVASAVYQRRTGPTYPLRGRINVAGQQLNYRLPRSAENIGVARIVIPDPGVPGRVLWRCYPTADPFTVVFMAPESDGNKKMLTARIPPQEAAGKVEYRIEIGSSVIPDNDETVILRFKGPVSTPVLISHILLIFIAMLISTRAGLGAVFGKDEKNLPWMTLGLVLVGGIILGAFVQKAAFGAYWTGWPYGSDWTDNKTLFMFLGWLATCLLMMFPKAKRPAIVFASLLTLVVYLIPHSLRGSQLNYNQEQSAESFESTLQTDQ
ncbi:MAG: hypothetical protein LBH03_02605 [Holophagales bacterium]|nr:hypothetical protein [Holophagales bacterium]